MSSSDRQPARKQEADASAAVEGTLAKTPLAHLLVYAYGRRLSGLLRLEDDREGVTIALAHGFVRDVRTTSPIAYLGQVLYEQGAIDTDTLNATLGELAIQRKSSVPPKLHGELLLARGAISREVLDAALRQQIERKMLHAFSLSDATRFLFLPSEPESAGVEVDPFLLAWRGIRSQGRLENAKAVLARFGNVPLGLESGTDISRYGFSVDERAIAVAFRNGMRVPDDRHVTLVAYVLAITKALAPKAEAAPAPAPAARPPMPRFSTPPGMNQVSAPTISERVPVVAPVAQASVAAPVSSPSTTSPPPASSRRPPPRSMPPVKVSGDAKVNFQNAEVAFAQRNFEAAEQLCRHAVDEEPLHAEYLAFLAWIKATRCEGVPSAPMDEPLAMLDRALDLHAGCERAYMYRAHIRQRVGDWDGALSDFRTAHTLNPQNVEAAREVRLHDMRARQHDGRKGSGLFGKFLGKK